MQRVPIFTPGEADVSAEELCGQLGVSRKTVVSALRELESFGFIANVTPDRPPLKSSWRITCFPYQGQPPTKDYKNPEVLARIERRLAGRKAAYRRRER